jgi:hypothetical protein
LQAIDARPMLRIAIDRATAWGDLELGPEP